MASDGLDYAVGEVIDGRFEVRSVLGEGGYGVVVKATQRSTGQEVAVKILRPRGGLDEEALAQENARFEREMQLIARLKHPNIVRLIDSGQLSSGAFFMVLEYIEGETLDAVLARTGPMTSAEAGHVMGQVLDALSCAHDAGVIHRDLKPQNIMVTAAGYRRNAMVLDFGIAAVVEEAREASYVTLTASTEILGTPAYMPPDQIRKQPPHPGFDIYTWGLVFTECLTGERVVSTGDVMEAVAHQLAPQPFEVPREIRNPSLRRLLARAIAKNPKRRYASVADVIADLERVDLERTERISDLSGRLLRGDDGRWRRSALAVTSALLIGGALLAWWSLAPPTLPEAAPAPVAAPEAAGPQHGQASLAVLPLRGRGLDPSRAYLADGISEELILALSQVEGLYVAPRTSSFRLRDSDLSLADLGAALGVAHVIEGSVSASGEQVRASASLVRVAGGERLWTGAAEGSLDDLLAIQDRLAREITTAMGARHEAIAADATPTASTAERHTDNPEAYRLYLQGRFYWNKRDPKAAEQAIALFERAVALEPDYALAYAGLADMYTIQAWFSWTPARAGYTKGEQAARRALALDPSMGQVYASLAFAIQYRDFDWAGAEAAYRRCVEQAPEFATGHQWFASLYLIPLGRFEEGREQLERALELDPITPIIQTDRGDVDYYSGAFEAAAARFQRTVEMHPAFFMAHYSLGRALTQLDEREAALAALERARELSHDSTLVVSYLGYAHARFGQRAEARALLEQLHARADDEYVQAAFFAQIHAGLGERDEAFRWLDLAVEDRSSALIYINVDPAFASLRDDPRYDALITRVGLPDAPGVRLAP